MPNHVTSIVTVTGSPEEVARFVETHIVPPKDEQGDAKDPNDRWFDFNTVIPQPAILKETTNGGHVDIGMFALYGYIDKSKDWLNQFFPNRDSTVPYERWPFLPKTVDTREKLLEHLRQNNPQALREAEASKRCLDETGHISWYEWCIENWGTKWGAYDYEERERGEGSFTFKFETAWSFPEPIFRKLEQVYPDLVFDVAAYDEGSNFGCRGQFNGRRDYRCDKSLATEELYERVYGYPIEKYDDEDEDEDLNEDEDEDDIEDEQYIEEHNATDEDDEDLEEDELNDGLDS